MKLRKIERQLHRSLECTKSKLYISALNDECLPIVCAVDKFHGFLVNLSERDVTEEKIKKILERHLTTKYLKGLISHMKSELTSMLKAEQTPSRRSESTLSSPIKEAVVSTTLSTLRLTTRSKFCSITYKWVSLT